MPHDALVARMGRSVFCPVPASNTQSSRCAASQPACSPHPAPRCPWRSLARVPGAGQPTPRGGTPAARPALTLPAAARRVLGAGG